MLFQIIIWIEPWPTLLGHGLQNTRIVQKQKELIPPKKFVSTSHSSSRIYVTRYLLQAGLTRETEPTLARLALALKVLDENLQNKAQEAAADPFVLQLWFNYSGARQIKGRICREFVNFVLISIPFNKHNNHFCVAFHRTRWFCNARGHKERCG
jgi:hypothetical protein